MKLNKKRVLIVVIASFLTAIFLPLLLTTSITDIYGCAGTNLIEPNSCDEVLDGALWKIQVGIALQFAGWAIFIVSLTTYIWMLITKKP